MAPKKKTAKQVEGKNPDNGRFLPGNRWWLARSSHGPKPKFANAEDLWAACLEFFAHIEENPIIEEKVFHTNGLITRASVSHMRAMTEGQLCLFLDIDVSTWKDWRANRPDLSAIITRVDQIMHDQKLTGAAADLLNPNIIARHLGLSDKQEVAHSGEIGTNKRSKDAAVAAALAENVASKAKA